jgi:hypothetical protein
MSESAMTATAPSILTAQSDITIDRLLHDPLPDLFAEANVKVVESSITDERFCGAVVVRDGKPTALYMPAGRSEIENNVIARFLIGKALHMDLTPLPEPFDVEVHPMLPGIPA